LRKKLCELKRFPAGSVKAGFQAKEGSQKKNAKARDGKKEETLDRALT